MGLTFTHRSMRAGVKCTDAKSSRFNAALIPVDHFKRSFEVCPPGQMRERTGSQLVAAIMERLEDNGSHIARIMTRIHVHFKRSANNTPYSSTTNSENHVFSRSGDVGKVLMTNSFSSTNECLFPARTHIQIASSSASRFASKH